MSLSVWQKVIFTLCIFTGGSGGDVYSQQGDGTGRDFEFDSHSIYDQVKYIGHADFAAGIWIGLELRNPKGKKSHSNYYFIRIGDDIF